MENKNKKKVLFLITKSNWGGAQKYVFDLATGLPKENFDITVALGGTGELKDKLEKNRIKTISINSLTRDISIFKEIKVFKEICKIIRAERPDILHINSSKAGGLGALAGRIMRVPYIIFTAHGWAFNEDRTDLQKKIVKCFHWITIVLSHKTITVSKMLASQMISTPLVKDKIVNVYSGVKIPNHLSKEESQKIIAKNHPELFQKNNIWIGTIAELHKNKGYIYQIEAIEKLKNEGFLDKHSLVFVWIGDGEERQTLKESISSKGLDSFIKVVGQIPEAPSLLKALDIFILTSTTEALGYVLLEAGITSLPTIATCVGGIPEIIENEKTGILVESRNSDEIAEGIKKLVENRTLGTQLGENLFSKVSNDFNTHQMIQKTIEIYEER
jgi:glycosyltransferase involved in cell wall biosynthesis